MANTVITYSWFNDKGKPVVSTTPVSISISNRSSPPVECRLEKKLWRVLSIRSHHLTDVSSQAPSSCRFSHKTFFHCQFFYHFFFHTTICFFQVKFVLPEANSYSICNKQFWFTEAQSHYGLQLPRGGGRCLCYVAPCVSMPPEPLPHACSISELYRHRGERAGQKALQVFFLRRAPPQLAPREPSTLNTLLQKWFSPPL